MTMQNNIAYGNNKTGGNYGISCGGGAIGTVTHNNSFGNTSGSYFGIGTPHATNLSVDPLFVPGTYYLQQIPAGDQAASPCVDSGSDTSENLGLGGRTTHLDYIADIGVVDMGYHYVIHKDDVIMAYTGYGVYARYNTADPNKMWDILNPNPTAPDSMIAADYDGDGA
jgi:hypothetical protein